MWNILTYKIIIISLFSLTIGTMYGQVKFNVVPQIEGIFTVDRVFQFSFVNLSPNETADGYVEIKVRELGGEMILAYKSVPFKIKPMESSFGTNIDWLKSAEYGISKNSSQLKDMGTLTYGKYSICYTFVGGKRLSDAACTEVNVKPQLPPQLVTPSNGSVINFITPVLTWLPPMPDLNLNYQYSIKLVELRDNQTCAQALQQNNAIVQERNYDGTNLQVSEVNGLGLEFEKSYCWQVGVYHKNKLFANTEIWQFKVEDTKITDIARNDEMPYYNIKENLDGDNLLIKRVLKIAYNNQFNSSTLKYFIYSEDNKDKIILEQPILNLSPGVNQIALDCQAMKGIKSNKPYIIEIHDENNTKYYCRFTYEKK